ncbi:hypothetical protein [Ulvibacterium sp.]|uniref:hypothetical protein n=1 Tax=Ulvibacterium sp. TaxID=2665914 RepID=UPI003BAB2033
MTTDFKPDGYNSVSTYFIIKDPQRLIDLLKTVFDGELLRCFKDYGGSVGAIGTQIKV